jgi:hypothetical protein
VSDNQSQEAQFSNIGGPIEHADWFLRSLVDIVNNNDTEIGITLQVSGMLVSGLLVGGKKYFDGFANDIASPLSDPDDSESARQFFAQYGDVTYPKKENKEEQEYSPPNYIHLKGARFFHINGVVPSRGIWWRGRLSHVSGFILGNMSIG